MKYCLTLMALLLVSLSSYAQSYAALANKEFASVEEYKSSEPQVLEAVNYLLTHPVSQEELNRQHAFLYIFKWMEGTPDYTFSLDADLVEFTKGDPNYLSLFLAALVKTELEDKANALDAAQLNQKATDLLVDYCADDAMGLKPNRSIKKALKARG